MIRKTTLILARFILIGFIFYVANRFINTLEINFLENSVLSFIFLNYAARLIALFLSGVVLLVGNPTLPSLKSEALPALIVSILVLMVIPFFMTGTFFVFYGKTLEFSSILTAFVAGCCTIILLSSPKGNH